jgi:tRNA G18 (ribose-2'-O)-methylase SpoU
MKATITKIYTANSDFQYIETLQRNRTKRNRAREFVVEGVRAINQAVLNHWTINALVYTRDRRLSDWAEGVIEHAGAKVHFVLSTPLMEKISQKEDTSELIAVAVMPDDELARIPERENFLVVVLDRPTNSGNLGTVIRSCDALRVDGVIITGHSVDLYDPETIRATTGSFFSLPAVRLPSYKELIPWFERLRQRLDGFQIIGTSARAEIPIQSYDFTAPTILLVGNESHGLSENARALCDAMVTIPMYGSATSLNVACATSILLYEVDRQRRNFEGKRKITLDKI